MLNCSGVVLAEEVVNIFLDFHKVEGSNKMTYRENGKTLKEVKEFMISADGVK